MKRWASVAAGLVTLIGGAALALALEYEPAGRLVSGSGTGRADTTVYAPAMRFPFEEIPVYANSQVYGRGGYLGPGGGQCDAANYAFPWRDNFCESRSWETPMCPTGNGHQGQDIRPRTCADDTWWAVAAEDGQITGVGSYSVTLTADSGTQYRYLHLSMDRLAVSRGERVRQGQRVGLVSNDFGGEATTIHLHFEILQNVAGMGGIVHVPPYASLVASYERLEVPPEPCPVLPARGGVVDDGQPSCVRLDGPAQYWRTSGAAGVGGGLRWTHAFAGSAPSNVATWSLTLASSGDHVVEVSNAREWVVANGYDQSRALRYRVRHAGVETDVVVDQSSGVGWVSLGEFRFAEGGDQWVRVFDDTGEDGSLERKIVVDAVRLTPVEVGPPECAADECASRSGCGAWSECVFDEACATVGQRSRVCAEYACLDGGCAEASTPRRETETCTRSVPDAEPGAWSDVGGCDTGPAPCASVGVVEQRRTTCVDGRPVEESRRAACTVVTDGLALDAWSPWGTCVAGVDGSGVQQRERRVCQGGTPTDEVERRSCATGGAPSEETGRPRTRPVPRASSRSGCSSVPESAPPGAGGAMIGLLALVRQRRRRR